MRIYCIILFSLSCSFIAHAQWSNGSGLEPNPPRTVFLNSSNEFRSVRIKDSSAPLGLAGKLQVQANVDNSLQYSNRLVNFVGLNMSSSENVLRLEATLSNSSQNPYLIRGIADLGSGNSPTNFFVRSSGASSFNGVMNLLSVNDTEDIALRIKNDQALWYNDDYFSWGFGGNWNQFADGITIGSATPPGTGTALRITSSKNIFLEGGDIAMNAGNLLVNTGDIISSSGDHVFNGGDILMNTGDIELTTGSIIYKSDASKRISFENTSDIKKSFIESGANFLRLGDLNQLLVEIDNQRYFTISKLFDASIFSKKVHFNPETPITFGTDPNSPDVAIQLVSDDLIVGNANSNGKIGLISNNGDVLIGNANTTLIMQDNFVGINESSPQHTLHVNGNVGITGEFFALSDERIKTDVVDLSNANEVLTQLRPVSYNYLKQEVEESLSFSTKGQYGLIAQEVEKVLPNLITQHHSTTTIDNEEVQLKGVNYNGLIAILVKGHQEQAAQIEGYKEALLRLTERIDELENSLHLQNAKE